MAARNVIVAAGAEPLVLAAPVAVEATAVQDESAANLKPREELKTNRWKPIIYWGYVAIGAIVLYTLFKK